MSIPETVQRPQAIAAAIQLRRFVECLYEPTDIVELRTLPARKSEWHSAAELPRVAERLIQFNLAGHTTYGGVNPRSGKGGRRTEDVLLARCLFADFDKQSPTEVRHIIERAGLPLPTIWINSGHGLHCYWRLLEPLHDRSQWTALQKQLIARVKSDAAVHDPPRIMRLPGFFNLKTEPHVKCQIINSNPNRRYSLQRLGCTFRPLLPGDTAKRDTVLVPSVGFTSDVLRRATMYVAKVPGVGEGERNYTAFKLAAAISNDFQLPPDTAWPLLVAWNRTNKPPLAESELRNVMLSGGKHAQQQPGNKLANRRNTVSASASAPVNPQDLQLPYIAFPVEALPQTVARYVAEAAEAIGCDASYVALPLFVCIARAIGNTRVIQLKSTWTEPAIIWGAIVGRSGTHKSPAQDAATPFLERIQAGAVVDHTQRIAQYNQSLAIHDKAYQHWKRTKSTESPPSAPDEPHLLRFLVGDITIEALADLLANQYDGVVIVRHELAGWLDGLAEYKGGKGSDTGHWLASWHGAPLTVDRKTGAKRTIHVPRAAVSITGGIQPGILRRAIGREHLQDGLCARFLLAMPEPRTVQWSEATISHRTEAALAKVFDRLLDLEHAADCKGNPIPFVMPLTIGAKQKWIEYYNRHRDEQMDLDDDLAAAWSKLEAYTARFALLFQLCSFATGEGKGDMVEEMAVQTAIIVSDFFAHEARRVYHLLAVSDGAREHLQLIELIRRQGGSITVRELMRTTRRYRQAPEAEAALQSLATAGIGQWHSDNHNHGRGQPTRRFRLTDTADADTNSAKHEENGITVIGNSISGG